jgi:DNA-binding MarR family transcriptional regulator
MPGRSSPRRVERSRRGILVELTAEGRALLRDSLAPVVGRAEVAWLASLTLEEQETLIQLLGKLQTHLYDCMDSEPDHPDLTAR